MTVKTHRPRFLYALILVPMLMGAKDKKGCCGRGGPVDTGDTNRPDVDTKIQVTSIDPSSARPSVGFTARVRGAAFQKGASVKFGSIAADEVEFENANTLIVKVSGLPEGNYDVVVTNPDGESATLRQGLSVRASSGECSFVRVNFDFDQAALNSDAKAILDAKMPCYQSGSGRITIEGHADERGTTEYNLALGERRAEQVKRYVTNQGVATSRVDTVTFGEEKPVANGHDEAAWAQNRRADIHASE